MHCLESVRNQPPAGASRQRGMALFVTIVMVTIAMVILSAITYRHQLDTFRNGRSLISEQAILLALSAESWAKSILRDDAQNNDIDSLDDDWAQVIPVLPVEGGLMTGCIVDMQSMYNINNLGAFDQDSYTDALDESPSDDIEIYLNILEAAELDFLEERAAVVIDWIDQNSDIVTPGSAEDAEYSLEDPARLAGNSPLYSLNELVTVYGYSLADVRALDSRVTALPFATPINVNTADEFVLASLSTLLDEFMIEGIVEGRPYDDADEFYEAIETEIGYMTLQEIKQQIPSDIFGVSSDFFELRAQVSIAGEVVALKSLFQRQGSNQIKTISRSFQYIPDLQLVEGDENPIPPLCNQNTPEDSEEEEQ